MKKQILEKTLVILKPDAIEKCLMGRIISRFEDKGFILLSAEYKKLKDSLVMEHYREHKDKSFFKELCDFMASQPVFLMVWCGKSAIDSIRRLVGNTDSLLAEPGTIRGDFSLHKDKNLIHASDSVESASREIHLFFGSNHHFDF